MTPMARRTLIGASATLALIAALSGPSLADPDAREAIESRLQQYEDRFNARDAEALARLFNEDVVYYGPLGTVFEGRDAVEQRYRGSFEAGFRDMRIETIEIDVLGDTAWDIARYTITGPNGDPLEGYHLAILKKVDGDWMVQRTLVNAVMPEPPGD
ncbi:MAG: ketosteroid isomerase related protein [Rhodobacteraceae bacterium HLUCCA12]|nr:MAG: ketosteroid isomerase related protein [Rhodobacteraceae bacterium HLUCCA12]